MQLARSNVSPRNIDRMAKLFCDSPVILHDEQAEPVGAVRYLLLNKSSGCVEYAVLRFDPDHVSGYGDYPVPWDLLTYHRGIGGYVVRLDTRILADAPRCDDVWPSDEYQFCVRIHAFYGLSYPA